MKPTTKKHLSRITEIIWTVPIPPRIVKAAFERFRETGELPEDERLARKVIDRARCGCDAVYADDWEMEWAVTIRAEWNAPERADDPVLEALYWEAVYGSELVRFAARHVLRTSAKLGRDVTQPVFQDSLVELPEYGAVGLHVLGFPERLAKPPYEEQARRLFERFDQLRERVPQGDRRWFTALGRAIEDFHTRCAEPDDDLVRDAVLADAEMRALMLHFVGEDVGEVMDDLAARALRRRPA